VLQAVSPLATLARGYAVVRRSGPGREVVSDAGQVRLAEAVEVLLHRGVLFCRVEGKKEGEDGVTTATPDQSSAASTS
jgi:exodeoxyribonuclease VII large subunit